MISHSLALCLFVWSEALINSSNFFLLRQTFSHGQKDRLSLLFTQIIQLDSRVWSFIKAQSTYAWMFSWCVNTAWIYQLIKHKNSVCLCLLYAEMAFNEHSCVEKHLSRCGIWMKCLLLWNLYESVKCVCACMSFTYEK